ncbi:hypothetical protein HZB00_02015 [Candidatus Woesearchaeota archaeon]|nr:hypothetical protein [Candidatus Woesearchaeota archaeon]
MRIFPVATVLFLLLVPFSLAGSFFEGSVWDSWLSNDGFGASTGWLFKVDSDGPTHSCTDYQPFRLLFNQPITLCGITIELVGVNPATEEVFMRVNHGDLMYLRASLTTHLTNKVDVTVLGLEDDGVSVQLSNAEPTPRIFTFLGVDWF